MKFDTKVIHWPSGVHTGDEKITRTLRVTIIGFEPTATTTHKFNDTFRTCSNCKKTSYGKCHGDEHRGIQEWRHHFQGCAGR